MLFSSITFLFYFLPAVLVLYFIAPARLKNPVLLAASLIFYAWGGVQYAILMVALITMGWLFGFFISKNAHTGKGRLSLAFALACTIAALLYFKYADFTIESLNFVTGADIPLLNIALPIGISFYTFQLISYLVDVYRGAEPQRNWITLATYIAMFPQLVAGPIVRYGDIEKQLVSRKQVLSDISEGGRRFVLGLAKKVLIANQMSELCATFRGSDDLSILFYWLYAAAFALCIYFDFSGYSDMAIGLGKVFGFSFRENFNYPFTSTSATEFWRRWHISLGSWFRDYVYIPLGGNRVSAPRWIFNILVVWLLTGLWHGAAWNFALWGLLFAALLVIEKLWLKKHLDKHRLLGHAYLLLIVLISFTVFNADGMGGVASDLAGMIGLGLSGEAHQVGQALLVGQASLAGQSLTIERLPLVSAEAVYYLRSYAVVLVLAIIGSTPLVKNVAKRAESALQATRAGQSVLAIIEPLGLAALLLLCTAYLVDGSFNPFLYFRF